MTMPPLPPAGDTSWRDDWAQAVHDATATVTTGRLSDATLTEQVRDLISTTLAAGANTTITVDDATNTVTIASPGGGGTVATIPAGSTLTVQKSGSTWPARPTARADVFVQWKGADPSPAIVSSGTGGMLDGVDTRFVTP